VPTVPSTPTATVPATWPPTPTAAATAVPTRVPRPLYLPLTLREQCVPGQKHMDVALVIDASTSMQQDRTVSGRTKMEAAIEAAVAFVDTLALPLDQVAVVVFNADAQVVQQHTGTRAEIDAALARLPQLVRQQTRIDRGIEVAHEELVGPRRNPANQPVMIVLTDGLANPEPASTAVRRAQAAKDDGITIFTIGLGKDDELDIAQLVQMASRPGYFYRAPDGEDLLAIYRTIAVEIPCPREQFWGRR
jgi:Mg-chelatase subunit ChlD